jgi:hypothetical protein
VVFPYANGVARCRRFHKTLLNEFYRVAFREKRNVLSTSRSISILHPWNIAAEIMLSRADQEFIMSLRYPEPPEPKATMPESTRQMNPRPIMASLVTKAPANWRAKKRRSPGTTAASDARWHQYSRVRVQTSDRLFERARRCTGGESANRKRGTQGVLVAKDLSKPEHCHSIINRAV